MGEQQEQTLLTIRPPSRTIYAIVRPRRGRSRRSTHNLISIHDSLQPMSNGDDRNVSCKLTSERALDHSIRLVV